MSGMRRGGRRRGSNSVECAFVLGVLALSAIAGVRLYASQVEHEQEVQEAALQKARGAGPLGMPEVPKGTSSIGAPRPAAGGIKSGRIDEKDLSGSATSGSAR